MFKTNGVKCNAQSSGSATNPHEEFKRRKTTLHFFFARNAKFSNSDQLFTDDNFCFFVD